MVRMPCPVSTGGLVRGHQGMYTRRWALDTARYGGQPSSRVMHTFVWPLPHADLFSLVGPARNLSSRRHSSGGCQGTQAVTPQQGFVHLCDGTDSGKSLFLLSAAFDTINHTILLTRLQHTFGISDTALSWFTSYLSDRKHTTHQQHSF